MNTGRTSSERKGRSWAALQWGGLHLVALGLALLADLLAARAAQEAARTFLAQVAATQIWFLGLGVALVWVGLFIGFRRAGPTVSRQTWALLALATGLLLVTSFPPLVPLFFGPVRRFWLHQGARGFTALTLKLLFLLDLWGLGGG